MLILAEFNFTVESAFYPVHSFYALDYFPQSTNLLHLNCIHLFTFLPPVRKSNVVVILMHADEQEKKCLCKGANQKTKQSKQQKEMKDLLVIASYTIVAN